MLITWAIVFLAAAGASIFLRSKVGLGILTWFVSMMVLLGLGMILARDPSNAAQFIPGAILLTLGGMLMIFGFVEFALLRVVGMFRLGALTRVTYYEALLQPFTLILIVAGTAMIIMLAFFPFFTINEDHKMYRDVAISLVFLFTLPVMVYASTKVIDEEIENKTMLTLMSKPIARWQVIVGKYLGVLLVCTSIVGALGLVTSVASYVRYFDDMRLDYYTAMDGGARLNFDNLRAELALAPALLLQLLQVATLAAVSVAVSTRYGLVVNITAVVTLYIVANLARYGGTYDLPGGLGYVATGLTHVLPGLGYLDLSQRLVYGQYNYADYGVTAKYFVKGLPSYGEIWTYTAMAGVYAVLYICSALSFGIAAFRTRELS